MLTLAAAILTLQVTLDARSRIADLPMPAIVGEVREVWKPYLDVVFRTESDPVTACGPALQLLITDQADVGVDRRSRARSLGWIEFVGHEQPAPTITVSARTARTMLKEGRWLGRPLGTLPSGSSMVFLARALGRAIAHEIGHYALRSTAHQTAGLMRQRLTVADIMDSKLSHFRLGRDEEALLARRLASPDWTLSMPESPDRAADGPIALQGQRDETGQRIVDHGRDEFHADRSRFLECSADRAILDVR
jgi:hypothetical protein